MSPPYRPSTIVGFCRLLHCPPDTLKNIIQLMRFEVQPELVVQNNLKWSISLCLTIPPVAPNVFPVGQAGTIGNKEKILIFMHLTRANLSPGQVISPLYLKMSFFIEHLIFRTLTIEDESRMIYVKCERFS